MGTQRLDLPCSFTRNEAIMVSLTLERPSQSRGPCSFRPRQVTLSSSAIIAQTSSWEGKREIEGTLWSRKGSFKRYHECGSFEDSALHPAKKKRTVSSSTEVFSSEDFCYDDDDDEALPPCTVEESLNADQFQAGTRGYPNDRSGSTSSPSDSEGSWQNDEGNSTGVSAFKRSVESTRTEHEGLELLNLLIECSQSISTSNHIASNFYLSRLGSISSPTGSTPIHRLVAYFTEALALRAAKQWPNIFCITPPRELAEAKDKDEATALRLLNNVTPIPRFIHFTLNERLLQAFDGKERVHIIDFDIKQGLQWPSLFQSLASLPNRPGHVRLTGIGESKQEVHDTGVRLAGLAQTLKLPFEFHSVVDRIQDVRLWMLHVKESECVAVNCVLQLHHALYNDSRIVLADLLRLIRSTNPSIVLMAETEAEHNELRWEKRFVNALKYYSAVFDLLDHSLAEDSSSRLKIEEMFARKIRNIVACEGGERVELHQRFDRWKRMMEDGRFKCAGFSEREIFQSKMLLRMYDCENYSVEKDRDGGGLTLKWMEQHLYTVSAWAPIDTAYQPG
ncbi:Scarecrow-like protein 28 [Platanthera guangdongensis]|uniref:Scarecrow-like protein 28 n=1 Tax=Platanthera guangdongensis TaxID=2320717 RepID=A0ABR2MI00_9ASPA